MNQIKDSSKRHWDEISRVARTKIVQLTILVPVLGYLILFSAWFESNFRVFGEFPTWKIYFLYFGFTFLAIGSIIYNIFCPRLIQIYGFATAYISNELKIMFEVKQVELISNLLLLSNKAISKHKDVIPSNVSSFLNCFDIDELNNEVVFRMAISRKLPEITKIEPFMFAYFELLEQNNRAARYAVYYLFRAGFLLIAIPSIVMFVEIITIHIWR